MRNLYAVLEVSPSVDAQAIRSAYRRLARIHHPDHSGGAEARFKEIAAAYEVLGNDQRRAAYDQQRAAWLQAQGAFLCTGCGQGLRIPVGFSGAGRCARCKAVFEGPPAAAGPAAEPAVMTLVAERLREHGARVGSRLLLEVADAAEQVSDEFVAEVTAMAVAGVRRGLAGLRRKLRGARAT